MTLSFTIPVWLLWAIGIPAAVILVLLAVFGIFALRMFKDWPF